MSDNRYRLVELNNGIFVVQERGIPISGPNPVLYAWENMFSCESLEEARAKLQQYIKEDLEEADRILGTKLKRVIE